LHIYFEQELREKSTEENVLVKVEVRSFLDARYVSAPQAIWTIFEYKMHDISHAIIRLAVHLPHEQTVYFTHSKEQEALEAATSRETTLTAWFKLNEKEPPANRYLYAEIPEHFVFDRDSSSWQPRKQHRKLISQMYTVSLNEPERYYLRLLLLNVRGATSFDYLKTVNNIVYKTFKEAAIQRNLLADDKEWENALEEAGSFRMPQQLRELFAFICIFGTPKNPRFLWDKFRSLLIEDYLKKFSEIHAELIAMREIEDVLRLHGKNYKDFGLPTPSTLILKQIFNAEKKISRGEK